MLDGVSIVRSEKVKDELILDGNDIELVSRSAALINQVCFSPMLQFGWFLLAKLVAAHGIVGSCSLFSFLLVDRNAM